MKVLVTDDDPLTLDALATCIEAEGFEVFKAENGLEALELWQESSPDLVCLDIMMPKCNGYEVCKTIREKDSKVPILFLSAKSEESDLIAGLDLGADDFIRKPFNRGEVMARIRAALRRSAHLHEPDHFEMNELLVSPQKLLAEHGEAKIDLTPREVSMLKLLYDRAGVPVSRDTFWDHCWGMDYFPDSRTLDQHIFTLRKKIEQDLGCSRIIGTVRGVGYRYSPDQS
ncbi:DNA-binding response regulator [Oceaniferula spumae]|uniref:DNA-binding response regulator n=1 Tax=Oceaniferula spumae TaxID=2979115 RepID=A0AAT9FJT7_9BACT